MKKIISAILISTIVIGGTCSAYAYPPENQDYNPVGFVQRAENREFEIQNYIEYQNQIISNLYQENNNENQNSNNANLDVSYLLDSNFSFPSSVYNAPNNSISTANYDLPSNLVPIEQPLDSNINVSDLN